MRTLLVLKLIFTFTVLYVSTVSANESNRHVTETLNQPDFATTHNVKPKHKQTPQVNELPVKSGEALRVNSHVDFWFYDAWVTLHNDHDYDGFYSRFSLTFDADTSFYQAPVHAIVYLGKHDTYTPFHVTGVFNIFGESSDDIVQLDNELLTGYPTDDYDILIELIDAESDLHVATIDAYNDADLSFNSLESVDFDQPFRSEVVVEYHAGSWGMLGLVCLTGLVLARRLK